LNATVERNITEWPKLEINYWGITKCANSSIKAHLNQCSGNPIIDQFKTTSVNKPKFNRYITEEQALSNGYVNFTVTRHPIQRFVSAWKDLCINRKARGKQAGVNPDWDLKQLAKFVADKNDHELDVHFRSQSYFINDQIEHVFQLENLNTQWNLDIPVLEFHIHSTPGSFEVTNYVSDLIKQRYRIDFIRFGY